MIVYDVVREVSREAARHCSYPPGRFPIDVFARRVSAEEFAADCNRFCRTEGVRYVVVGLDECDPARACDDAELAREWAKC
jgi:hypothetical protein